MLDPQAKPIAPNSHLFHSWAAELVLSGGVPENLPGLLLGFFKLLEKNEPAVSVGACVSPGHLSLGSSRAQSGLGAAQDTFRCAVLLAEASLSD